MSFLVLLSPFLKWEGHGDTWYWRQARVVVSAFRGSWRKEVSLFSKETRVCSGSAVLCGGNNHLALHQRGHFTLVVEVSLLQRLSAPWSWFITTSAAHHLITAASGILSCCSWKIAKTWVMLIAALPSNHLAFMFYSLQRGGTRECPITAVAVCSWLWQVQGTERCHCSFVVAANSISPADTCIRELFPL